MTNVIWENETTKESEFRVDGTSSSSSSGSASGSLTTTQDLTLIDFQRYALLSFHRFRTNTVVRTKINILNHSMEVSSSSSVIKRKRGRPTLKTKIETGGIGGGPISIKSRSVIFFLYSHIFYNKFFD